MNHVTVYSTGCSIEEDPHFDPYNDAVTEAKALIEVITKKISDVAKMQFFEFDGSVMNGDRTAAERELLYNAYEEKKKKAEKLLAKRERALQRQVEWRRQIAIEFLLAEVDEATNSSSYRVRIFGQADASKIEDLLVKKDDWAGNAYIIDVVY
jgi:hypothetical protein